MLLIVAHHYVMNSGISELMLDNQLVFKSIFFYLSGAWGKTAINCFVMITGYFMCTSRITLKKFLKLLFQIEFYNIIIYFLFVVFGNERFSFSALLYTIAPVKVIGNEFISAFIVLFLLIPFLNSLFRNISERMHIRLIVLSLLLYSLLATFPFPGFSMTMNYISWFIVIYCISAYVRLYPKALFMKTYVWGMTALIVFLISALSIIICLFNGWYHYKFLNDSNKLLAVATAFCSFMFFKNLRIPYNKFINMVASASFGVLLIHANSDAMRHWLWGSTLKNTVVYHTPWCYIHFVCSVLGIYIICTGIDLLRIYFIEKPFFRFYDSVSPSLYLKLYSFENRLIKTIKRFL